MKGSCYRVALVSAMLPLVVGGCAMQGGAAAEPATPATSAPQAAAAVPQLATAAPQPTRAAARPTKASPPLAAPSALEIQYGIQITQIGLTAAGGLVDFRFKVLDAAKARKLLGDPANAPVLIAGDSPPLTPPHHALHGARYSDGVVHYILYPNVRSTIKPGVKVVVAMGDARLGPVTVQ